MPLLTLLFSQDSQIIRLTGEAMSEMAIELTSCCEVQEAVRLLGAKSFDAIIVDNSNAPGAVAVLSAAKSLPTCENAVGIVLAASAASLGLAEGARSHMVLYRPLSAERLRNGIKSALRLRQQDEDLRESRRARIELPATLRGAGFDDTLVFITNLSVGGAALRAGRSIPSSSIRSIEFALPDSNESISASVEPVWRDVQGRIGIRFADLAPERAQSLEKWLAAHAASSLARKAYV